MNELEKFILMNSHRNGEIIYIESPKGPKKYIFCDGKLYKPSPLYDYAVKVANEKSEKLDKVKSVLKDLLNYSSAYKSSIELSFGFDGEIWEARAKNILEEL